MTTPKRWYQLSMLQMLVAMAVVAVFVVKNGSIKPAKPYSLSEPLNYTVYLDDTPLALGSLQAGWPIPYWHALGTTSEGHVYLAAYPTYRVWALAANVVMCATTILVAIGIVNRLNRKSKPCPSPST